MAVFLGDEMVESKTVNDLAGLRKIISLHKGQTILSSVRKLTDSFITFLENESVLILKHSTKTSISLSYDTPETLGVDRIAAACGAWEFKKSACLIVDIGTCVTLDFLSPDGEFLGGNISPGPDLRFKAMNNFTSALPLEVLNKENEKVGRSTSQALQIGVKQGLLHEIQGTYDEYCKKFEDCHLVLTGGYASYFDSNLKGSIFAKPNLVFLGLKSILDYDV